MVSPIFKAQVTLSRCQQNLQQLWLMVRLFGPDAEGGLDDITLDSIQRLVTHITQECQSVDNLLTQSLI